MFFQCHLEVAPHFSSYERPGEKFKLGIAGHMQKVNASLALQLTRTWMKSQGVLKGDYRLLITVNNSRL